MNLSDGKVPTRNDIHSSTFYLENVRNQSQLDSYSKFGVNVVLYSKSKGSPLGPWAQIKSRDSLTASKKTLLRICSHSFIKLYEFALCIGYCTPVYSSHISGLISGYSLLTISLLFSNERNRLIDNIFDALSY